jgi:pyruvate/2-oxoglutarate dehydrogenase complex dihydrolipoamide dehydrogenase (E3) component
MKTLQESQKHYQLAVIGSGSGGREAALLGARKGLRTALVEGDRIGGVCFHSGCYAVRALQACAHQFRDSLRSGRFGNKVDLLKATLDEWMIAQSKVGSRLVDSFRAELISLKVDVYQAYGELVDKSTVQVIGGRGAKVLFTADNVIVATGSRPLKSCLYVLNLGIVPIKNLDLGPKYSIRRLYTLPVSSAIVLRAFIMQDMISSLLLIGRAIR